MTLYFPHAVQAMLDGHEVRMSIGVRFEFASQDMRVWQGGRGSFTDGDGNVWYGLGKFGQVSGIQGSSMLSVNPISMTLSGVDPSLMSIVRTQSDEIAGRRCGVYFLMFDENFNLLDRPFLSELYLMDRATFSVDGEARTMVVTMDAEPLFFSKHVPPVSMMTDADQQRKYPGDTCMQRVPLLNGRQNIYWWWG